MTTHQLRPRSSDPSSDYRYYYREGMPLRPGPPPTTPSPAWSHLRHTIFDDWMSVRDDWTFDSPMTHLLDDHMWQTDELMDAVVEMFRRVGSENGRAQFEQALTRGIDTVQAPEPELGALFEQLDTLPPWFDAAAAERGRVALCNVTESAQTLATSFAIWANAMETRTSAATGATGMFAAQPVKRNMENAKFFTELTYSDVHDRFSKGFQGMVRVRLIHAQANRGLGKVWGPEHYNRYGSPISSGFVVGGEGWFALMPLAADQVFGRPMPDSVWDDVAMHWGHNLYVLGVEDRLIPKTGAQMREMADYVFAHGGPANEYRPAVATAILSVYEQRGPGYVDRLLGGLATLVGHEQTRIFMRGTRWDGADLDRLQDEFAQQARAASEQAAQADAAPGAEHERIERARRGHPVLLSRLDAALEHARQAGVSLDYAGHDEDLDGAGFGASARPETASRA